MAFVNGYHHVTLSVDGAQEDYDFYTRTLGMKSVKKTVLFDAPRRSITCITATPRATRPPSSPLSLPQAGRLRQARHEPVQGHPAVRAEGQPRFLGGSAQRRRPQDQPDLALRSRPRRLRASLRHSARTRRCRERRPHADRGRRHFRCQRRQGHLRGSASRCSTRRRWTTSSSSAWVWTKSAKRRAPWHSACRAAARMPRSRSCTSRTSRRAHGRWLAARSITSR